MWHFVTVRQDRLKFPIGASLKLQPIIHADEFEIENGIFFPMSVAVNLATNYEKIRRRGTATILLSKHISCIAIDTFLIGMELYFSVENGFYGYTNGRLFLAQETQTRNY